jgi:hypothetical protein
MVLDFFYNKGMVYTICGPKGKTVNTNYITRALCNFLKVYKDKRPELRAGAWFFHWDNAPLHSTKALKDFLNQISIQRIEPPPLVT